MVFVFWNLGAAMTALFPGITLIGVARPTYLKSGRMMPENDFGQLRSFDAIYLGAVGYPGVPDHAYMEKEMFRHQK